jgi:citrate lyase subunit beta/citryl-CoA lyase
MTILVRRSNVIVSASDSAAVRAAGDSRADAITLVFPPAGDGRDPGSVDDVVQLAGAGGADVFMRVHARRLERDVGALVRPGVSGIALAGARTELSVQAAQELLQAAEQDLGLAAGPLEIVLILNSPRAVWDARTLVRASTRVRQVTCDEGALCRSYGVVPTPGADPCEFARGRIVIEAIAASRQPVAAPVSGVPGPALSDQVTVLALALRMKNLGCKGMVFAEPSWVDVVNTGFTPAPEEVEYSSAVRRVFAEAVAAGRAAVGMAGKMIDVPVDKRAQMVLELAAACATRDSRKHA